MQTAEATVRVAAISGEQIDPATRIEILKSEQEAIAKETKIKAEEKELKKQKQIQVCIPCVNIQKISHNLNKEIFLST